MLTWARERRSMWVTPSTCLIRRTIDWLSGCWRKMSMSAVRSGAWNGPGRATAWSGSSTGEEDGSVGVDGLVEGDEVAATGPVDAPATGPDEPLPQDVRS